ncbi:MAG: alpha/beta hydrolase [Betaproteobacteria bacterium]|nr:alpha/beta hydrolase [Betaproteobacteria bacterium]
MSNQQSANDNASMAPGAGEAGPADDDIAALLEQQGHARAVIGGLSMGGGVATIFHELYRARVLGTDPFVLRDLQALLERAKAGTPC